MRTKQNLNRIDWKFKKDCTEIPKNYPDDWESITLPHTWNALDGQDGGNDYFRGSCVYALSIDKPQTEDDIYLEIEAASLRAEVWLNGEKLAYHEGGFSAFRARLTGNMRDKENLLCIRVDNSDNGYVYPQTADFTFFGGLYRNISLIIAPRSRFNLDYYASEGIACTAAVEESSAKVTVKAWLTDILEDDTVKFIITDADGCIAAEQTVCADKAVTAVLRIDNPHLWQAADDPYLYNVRAQLIRGGEALDEVTVPLGIRSFAVDAEKGFILNRKPYPLRGVSRHQDREGKGWAISEEDMREDAELIREVGANTIRLAHYQHNRCFYELCDRMGFVVWAEIPLISSMNENPLAHENAKSQLRELIIQNYNHPSICFWGICNEITIGNEKPFIAENLREINDLAHELDPSRLTTMAQLTTYPKDGQLNFITDIVSYNHYFGWYMGKFEDNEAWLDDFHEKYPARPLGISEYGCEAVLKYHSDNPKRKDYTEEYQALYHEHMAKVIDERQWLWATHVWNMFDFAADSRDEGGVKGRNNKGLVTMDRKTKKDSFYLYKAYWSREPFVHLCGKRYVRRTGDTLTVRVYSNRPEVTLIFDDTICRSLTGDRVFVFDSLPFTAGKHTVTVKSGSLTDTAVFEKTDKPEAEYICPDSADEDAVPNWFEDKTAAVSEMTFDPAYFSVRDNISDILNHDKASETLIGALSSLVGMKLNRGMIEGMLKGKLEDMEHMLAMFARPDAMKLINAELQKIKK